MVCYRFPKPSATYYNVLNLVLSARKGLLRYFFVPRPEFMRKKYISSAPDSKTGRFNSVEYLSHPWYVKPSFEARWAPRAWLTWILRRKLPGDDGNKYAPEGYTFDEVGPVAVKGKGNAEMAITRSRLIQQNRGGCPFSMP